MPDIKYVSRDSATEQGIKIDPVEKTAENLIPKNVSGNVFYEKDGYISIEGSHCTKATNSSTIRWKTIPGIGRDADGVTTFPVTASEQTPQGNNLHLEYEIYVYDTGPLKIQAYFSPTLNFHNDEGLKCNEAGRNARCETLNSGLVLTVHVRRKRRAPIAHERQTELFR